MRSMRRRLPIVPVLLALLTFAACDAPPNRAGGIVIDTLPGGTVLVRNPSPRAAPDAALGATELMRIGAVDGEEPYLFGAIRDVLIGGDGRVYVLDQRARELRIFDAAGVHLGTAGRSGSGPGEFARPLGMRWHPDGTIWVMDAGTSRYTVLTPDGELVTTYPRTLLSQGLGWAGGFDRAGRLYDVAIITDDQRRSARMYVRYEVRDARLVATDTFPLPTDAEHSYFIESAQAIFSLPVPFAARPSWAFDGDAGVWSGSGERYAFVHRTLAGDTQRIVELARDPAPVTSAERSAARVDLDTTLTRMGGSIAELDLSRIPATRPAHGRLSVDDRGRIWIAATPAAGEPGAPPPPTTFDIFEPDGRHRGAVTLNVSPTAPLTFRGDRVAGVQRDELDVLYVVVYRLDF